MCPAGDVFVSRCPLAQQVGEEVPLAKVLDEGSDWKGRREQVIALKDQVRQLKEEQVRREGLGHDDTQSRHLQTDEVHPVPWRGHACALQLLHMLTMLQCYHVPPYALI